MIRMELSEPQVLDALRAVVDPEMGIDIVALGLIYDVRIEGAHVTIRMTLTLRGCPMHDSIVSGVKLVVLNLPGVKNVAVETVWDPPWSPAMMAEEAQRGLD